MGLRFHLFFFSVAVRVVRQLDTRCPFSPTQPRAWTRVRPPTDPPTHHHLRVEVEMGVCSSNTQKSGSHQKPMLGVSVSAQTVGDLSPLYSKVYHLSSAALYGHAKSENRPFSATGFWFNIFGPWSKCLGWYLCPLKMIRCIT